MGHWFLKFAGGDIEKLIISAFPANVDQAKIDGFMKVLEEHFYDYYKEIEMQMRKNLETMKIDYTSMAMHALKFTSRYQIRLPNEMVLFARTMGIMGFLVKEMNYDFKASKVAIDFFTKNPEENLKKLDTSFVPYKRMNREEAIEKLNNWLAYLVEIDPKLFKLVNDYVSQYNVFNK
jgi:predicted unusual protein kinase regulating ubiquinone biosynthesis (AarF/ABC1/UbiB family)